MFNFDIGVRCQNKGYTSSVTFLFLLKFCLQKGAKSLDQKYKKNNNLIVSGNKVEKKIG